jgi:hypothetical protein
MFFTFLAPCVCLCESRFFCAYLCCSLSFTYQDITGVLLGNDLPKFLEQPPATGATADEHLLVVLRWASTFIQQAPRSLHFGSMKECVQRVKELRLGAKPDAPSMECKDVWVYQSKEWLSTLVNGRAVFTRADLDSLKSVAALAQSPHYAPSFDATYFRNMFGKAVGHPPTSAGGMSTGSTSTSTNTGSATVSTHS